MRIHKEGRSIVFGSTIAMVALLLVFFKFIPYPILSSILGLALLIFYILIVRFFRNPEREINANSRQIVSPVDGKVVAIEEVFESEYLNSNMIQISVFMSPLNVHVTRNPIGGKVEYFKYHPGKYLVAWHPKSSTENERTTTVVRNQDGQKVLFRQIAGAVARRIRWYIKEQDSVQMGAEMGFIKFGSRVDVFVPLGTKIKVNLQQIVKGSESVIAEFD